MKPRHVCRAGSEDSGFGVPRVLMSSPSASNHQSSIINHQLRGSASDRRFPLPVGRDARIVPKFCVREMLPHHVTLCAQRNKKFFARRVFYRFNCCTNVAVRRVGDPKRDPSRLGTLRCATIALPTTDN